jgi:D-psicose/D-tagatose/L-ribulose 3-epimerase
MKLGFCFSFSGPENDPYHIEAQKRLLKMGYDFIEPSGWNISTYSDEDFDKILNLARQAGIRYHAANGLMPPDIKTAGPEMDLQKIEEYCEKIFYRMSCLGIQYAVFGSGKSKNLPEGYPKEKGYQDLQKSSCLMARLAVKHNITVVMEPLAYGEVNIINTVEEGYSFIKRVDNPNLKLLADIYHVYRNEEPLTWGKDLMCSLKHVHFSDPRARKCAHEADEYSEKFADFLKRSGYNGSVSLEGGYDNLEKDALDNLKVMRQLFAD